MFAIFSSFDEISLVQKYSPNVSFFICYDVLKNKFFSEAPYTPTNRITYNI